MDAEMENNEKRRLDDATTTIEFIAKYGAAAGLTALGTAILYDSLYWWLLDSRMLGYYVIADHVQTAVRVVVALLPATLAVGIATLAVYLAGKAFWRTTGPEVSRGNLVLFGLAFFVAAMLGLGADAVKPPAEVNEVSRQIALIDQETDALEKAVDAVTESTSSAEILELRNRLSSLRDAREKTISLFVVSQRKSEIFLAQAFLLMSGLLAMLLALVSGVAIGYARPGTTLITRPFAFILVVWVSMAAYFAVCESTFIKDGVVLTGSGLKNAPSDIIWLDNDRHLKGTVVRSLEKGSIIRDATNSTLLFVPREKIYRIDLQR